MNPSLMPDRKTIVFAVSVLLLAAGLAIHALTGPGKTGRGTGEALVGGPFTLTDHTGKTRTEQDFLGRYMLVFFGFTFCPDICPTELQVMMAARDMLGSDAERVQPVFVTVDPERDTPEVMSAYVDNFGPNLMGLTGTPAQIAAMAKAYRVYYAKTGQTETPDYLMDHSSIIYLMGPDGRFLRHFTYTTDAKALAEGLAGAMAAPPKVRQNRRLPPLNGVDTLSG